MRTPTASTDAGTVAGPYARATIPGAVTEAVVSGRSSPPPRPRSRRARAAHRLIGGLAAALLLFSSCTIRQNQQYQVDLVPMGYHAHLYRTTTMMIWFAHTAICGWNPGCTLQKIKDQAAINGIPGALSGFDFFFDDDDADFNEALMATEHPWPLSINTPDQYGCLGGYKNLWIPHSDGDWYADPRYQPWCLIGQPL